MDDDALIPAHGGYRKLRSFQVAQLVYDVTVRFCDRWIDRRSRTHDQMVQAARSGVQNIAEGSQASGTSRKMELKLTNVARASLEELKLDYEDFLRQRRLALWAMDDPRRRALVARRCASADAVAAWVKQQCDGPNGQDGRDGAGELGAGGAKRAAPGARGGPAPRCSYEEAAANAAHVLIGVACSLLDRQIRALATSFESEGGFTERLYRRRTERRKNQPPR